MNKKITLVKLSFIYSKVLSYKKLNKELKLIREEI